MYARSPFGEKTKLLKPILSSTWKVCIVLAVIIYASTFGIAFPQSTQSSGGGGDGYRLNYFSNANTKGAPDATVRIVNPGTTADDSTGDNGDLCANIYVFAPDQQLSECCGCKVAVGDEAEVLETKPLALKAFRDKPFYSVGMQAIKLQ